MRLVGGIRKVAANGLLLLVALAIPLLALEGFLRATGAFGARISWAVPDGRLGYRNAPHASFRWTVDGHRVSGRFNGHGWRGGDWDPAPGAESLRIAVLGDSFVEALQVEYDATFVALLERSLTDSLNWPVRVLNFGRSGFSQTEELLVLRSDVWPLDPDVVVLFFFPGNDLPDLRRETASNTVRPFASLDADGTIDVDTSFVQERGYRLRAAVAPIKRRSVLVSLLAEQWNMATRNAAATSPGDMLREGYLSLCTERPSPDMSRSWELNRALLTEMAGASRSRGVPFLLVTQEIPAYEPATDQALRSLDPTFDPTCFAQAGDSLAAALDIGHVALQGRFREAHANGASDLHWRGDGHWNQAGHRLVARTLEPRLRELLAPLAGVEQAEPPS